MYNNNIDPGAYGLGAILGSLIGKKMEDHNKRKKSEKDAQMMSVLQNPTSTEKGIGYDEYLQSRGGFYRLDENNKPILNSNNKPIQKYNNALFGADQGLLQDLVSGKYDNYGQVGGTRLNPSALESLKQGQQPIGETRMPQAEKQTGLFGSLQPDSGYTMQYSPSQPVAEEKGLIASVLPNDKPEITANETYKGPLSMALEYQQKPTIDTSNLTGDQKVILDMFKGGQISKEHASKFLDFDNAARRTYEAEVPNVTTYLSEAQMLKKAMENGYSASEAKEIVSLARMDINKQKAGQLIGDYSSAISSGKYNTATPILMELMNYDPKAALLLFQQSVGAGDFYNTETSRENAAIENRYGQKNAERQRTWNVEDLNKAYQRDLIKMGIANGYQQDNMFLGTNLGLNSDLTKMDADYRYKEKYGLFNPKPPAYVGPLNEVKGQIERELREAGGDPSMDNSNVKEAIDSFNDLFNKYKHSMDEEDLALWRYAPLVARIDQARKDKKEDLAQKLIAQLPPNMQKDHYKVEHNVPGGNR